MDTVKVKASTIIEVIIAMAVLGIVTGISLMIMSNIYSSTTSLLKQKMTTAIDAEISRIYAFKKVKNDIVDYDDFSIDIEFVQHTENNQLKVGYLGAYYKNQEEPIIEKRILIKVNE